MVRHPQKETSLSSAGLPTPHGLIHYDPSTPDAEYNHLLPLFSPGDKQPRGIYLEPIKWPPKVNKFRAPKRQKLKMSSEALRTYHDISTSADKASGKSVGYYTEGSRRVRLIDFSGSDNIVQPPEPTGDALDMTGSQDTLDMTDSQDTLDMPVTQYTSGFTDEFDEITLKGPAKNPVESIVYARTHYTAEQHDWLINHVNANHTNRGNKGWKAISAAYFEEFGEHRKPISLSQKWTDMKGKGNLSQPRDAAQEKVRQGKARASDNTEFENKNARPMVNSQSSDDTEIESNERSRARAKRYTQEQLDWLKQYVSTEMDHKLTVRRNWAVAQAAYTKKFGTERNATSLYQKWLQYHVYPNRSQEKGPGQEQGLEQEKAHPPEVGSSRLGGEGISWSGYDRESPLNKKGSGVSSMNAKGGGEGEDEEEEEEGVCGEDRENEKGRSQYPRIGYQTPNEYEMGSGFGYDRTSFNKPDLGEGYGSQFNQRSAEVGDLTEDGRIIVQSYETDYSREEESTIRTFAQDAKDKGFRIDWAHLSYIIATHFAVRRSYKSIVQKWTQMKLKDKHEGFLDPKETHLP